MSRWRIYNPNPVSRNVGDCAVRAVAAALDTDWETAFALITKNAYEMADMPSSNAVWGSVLRQNGFKRSVIPNNCPDCYTAEQFAKDRPEGVYVLGFGNHGKDFGGVLVRMAGDDFHLAHSNFQQG